MEINVIKFKVTQAQFDRLATMGAENQESYMESLIESHMDSLDSMHLRGDLKESEYHASVESIDSEVDAIYAQLDV